MATGVAASEMALRLGRTDLAVVALDSVQFNLQQLLRYEEAHATALRRLEMAQDAGDLNELGDSYAVAAWNACYLGLFEEAEKLAREGYERLMVDAPYYAVHGSSWHALASFFLGEWDDVLADVETINSIFGEGGNVLTSGFTAPWPAAAFVHEARGDRAASERLLADVTAVEEPRGLLSHNLSPELIRTLVVRGEPRIARERLHRLAEQSDTAANLALLLAAEAELYVAEERWSDVPAFAGVLRATAESTGARFLDPIADRLDGLAAAASATRRRPSAASKTPCAGSKRAEWPSTRRSRGSSSRRRSRQPGAPGTRETQPNGPSRPSSGSATGARSTARESSSSALHFRNGGCRRYACVT